MPFFNLRKEEEEHVKFNIRDKEFDLNLTMLKDMLRRRDGIVEDYKDEQVRTGPERGSLPEKVGQLLRCIGERVRDTN